VPLRSAERDVAGDRREQQAHREAVTSPPPPRSLSLPQMRGFASADAATVVQRLRVAAAAGAAEAETAEAPTVLTLRRAMVGHATLASSTRGAATLAGRVWQPDAPSAAAEMRRCVSGAALSLLADPETESGEVFGA